MKAVKKLLPGFLAPALLLLAFRTAAQPATLSVKDNIGINSNLNGLLEILPSGYNTAQKYPLLVLFQGIGSTGDGSVAALNSMITGSASSIGNGYIQDQFMNNVWPDSYMVNGDTYKFIVLVPQFVTHFSSRLPTPQEVDDLVDYAIANYSVDTTRIYFTGNSSGGGIVWEYASAGSYYVNRLAAILPFSGVIFPVKEKADIIRNSDVAVWAFHNGDDVNVPASFTEDFVDLINHPGAASPEAKATIFPGITSHDSWFGPYNRTYSEAGFNVYEWMLQFSRTVSQAHAGDDQNIMLPASSAALSASWTGGGGPLSYSWQKISGPSQGGLDNSTVANPNATNLEEGTYIFRVTITPTTGSPASDEVAITVYPPRIEAESFAAMSGVSTVATTDEGGGIAVTGIDMGDFMDYNINTPAAGNYTLRFRVASPFAATQFVVKDAGGTVLTTVDVFWTTGWEVYATLSRTVALPAGSQTLRIESTNPNTFNINWLQVLSDAASTNLPVNFIQFNAACGGSDFVTLSWRTAAEVNTKDFTVQRSVDGSSWTDIGSVPAEGQEGEERSYSFKALYRTGIYRIVGNDIDGKQTYSAVLKADCGARQHLLLYPNPVTDIAQLNIQTDAAARVRYAVMDGGGAMVLQGSKAIPAGTSQFSVDLERLPPGSYTMMVEWAGEMKTLKFIKH